MRRIPEYLIAPFRVELDDAGSESTFGCGCQVTGTALDNLQGVRVCDANTPVGKIKAVWANRQGFAWAPRHPDTAEMVRCEIVETNPTWPN